MNIKIYLSKVVKFLLICAMIAGALVALGSLYTAYIIDQTSKIEHYNHMIGVCNNKRGAIVKLSASTPVFGTGVEITCEYVTPNNRKL